MKQRPKSKTCQDSGKFHPDEGGPRRNLRLYSVATNVPYKMASVAAEARSMMIFYTTTHQGSVSR